LKAKQCLCKVTKVKIKTKGRSEIGNFLCVEHFQLIFFGTFTASQRGKRSQIINFNLNFRLVQFSTQTTSQKQFI